MGASITDKIHVGTTKNYWQYLSEMLGLEPFVYGINGHQWNGVLEQAGRLQAERGDDIDAILIFAGTNDTYSIKGRQIIVKKSQTKENAVVLCTYQQ